MSESRPPSPERHAGTDAVWQPRKVSVSRSVRNYSRFVTRMKIILPAAAGVLLLLVIILPQFHFEDDRFRLGIKNIKEIAGNTLNMVNARYFGTDDKGQPYSITAEGAREHSAEDKT